MAIKDSELDPVASVLGTDLIAVTTDPGGTPSTNRIAIDAFLAGRTLAAIASFGIRSSGAAFDLRIANSEVLTANRTLNISLNNAARSLTVAGDATISGTNTGDQTPTSLGLLIGTNVQAWNANLDTWATKTPPAGTLVITTAKTFGVSDNITLASDGTGTRTLNIGSGGTLGSNAFNSTAFLTANQTITLSGDISGSGATSITTAIGATKVTSTMLNADVFSTAHSWAGQQTFTTPILGTPASGVATNLTGLPPTTGIVGWPANAVGALTNNGSGALSWEIPSLPTGGGGGVSGTATYDPPSLLNGESDTVTVTVTGAAVGDLATVSFTTALPTGVYFSTPQITATDTAKVTLVNESGSTQDIASGTIKIATISAQNLFSSIPVSGQTTVTANSVATALTLVAGSGITITTDNTAKSVTFAASGAGGGTPGGSDTQIQFNDGGAFGGSAGFVFSKTTAVVALTAADAVTNTLTDVLTIGHNTSGTAAASFGGQVLINLESSTTADQPAAGLNTFWSTATHASRTSRLGLATVNIGGSPGTLTNKVVIGNDASQTMFMKLQNQDTLSSGDLVKLYFSDSVFNISAGFGAPFKIANAAGTNLVYETAFPSKHSFTISAVEVLTIDNSVIITPAANSVKGLIVKGLASQSANLQEWQDSSANVLGGVGPGGEFILNERSTTPSDPTQDTQVKVYVKGDKFVIQFNNGGTVRYATYDLTQSATSIWATSTSAP